MSSRHWKEKPIHCSYMSHQSAHERTSAYVLIFKIIQQGKHTKHDGIPGLNVDQCRIPPSKTDSMSMTLFLCIASVQPITEQSILISKYPSYHIMIEHHVFISVSYVIVYPFQHIKITFHLFLTWTMTTVRSHFAVI